MNVKADFLEFKQRVRKDVEDSLAAAFRRYTDSEVGRVSLYVAEGGHRWRAMVAIAAGGIFDPNAYEICLPLACGVELAHAASLVLDDLPSMDDGQHRRGKECAHRIFPRWSVDLTPMMLVTMAYQISLENPAVSHMLRVRCALELSNAGMQMIAGQELDLNNPQAQDQSDGPMLRCYRLKSGALYAAAASAGASMCGADDTEASRLGSVGMNLGLSYQCHDDIADATASKQETGKDCGKDIGKLTAVALYGVEGAKAKARDYEEQALATLEQYDCRTDILKMLIRQASWAPS